MELNLIADRKFVVKFINNFMAKNDLVFFDTSNFLKKGVRYGNLLGNEDIDIRNNLLIHIGIVADFDARIKNLKDMPCKEDRLDFIYIVNDKNRSGNEVKITETTFIWYPTKSESAKKVGKMLRKEVVSICNVGMEVVDVKYSGYNTHLRKYYWPKEVLAYRNDLYSPVNVQILPTLENDTST